MALTIIQSSVTLFEILCVIIVFASIFMQSRFFSEIFEHRTSWSTSLVLIVFFGILSIFGTLSGLSVDGAVVNVRDLGPMAAGLVCGPWIGIGSGLIGGLFRFAQGGPYMWTGLSAPLLSGILGGIVYIANRRQFVSTWIAVVLIALSETLISCYTLILVTKPADFFMIVTTVAIPMVVFNVIGMFIFFSVVYHTLDDKEAAKEMQAIELEVESKRNLATIINTIAYPVYVLDRDHRFVVVNESLCRFIGRPEDEILTRTPRDFFSESDAAFHGDMTEEVFLSRATREDEVTITKPDGQICTLISTSTLYRDASGQVFMVGVIQDITRRKRVEEALFQKNEELDQYFTHTLDLLCIADMDGYFRRLNNEWESALGYTPGEMEGKRVLDFVHPDDRKATLGILAELRAGKKVLQFMNRYLHRDGSFRWIEWRIFPAGNVFYAVARDVTEQKKMMEQIQASLAEKETLLKEVHHRVKNNLQISDHCQSLEHADTEDSRSHDS